MRRVLTPQRWVVLALAIVGVVVRLLFLGTQSGDFRAFLSHWYAFISNNGHLAALRDDSLATFVDARFALPAAGIQLASISTYLSYFANREVLPLKVAAALASLRESLRRSCW